MEKAARSLASSALSFCRGVTRSMSPCSRRNSADWGEVGLGGFLDDARACEADEGLGFGEDDVSQ